MKRYFCLIMFFALVWQWLNAQVNQIPLEKKSAIIRIAVPNHHTVYSLQDQFQLSVIDAQENYVDAYADQDLIQILRNAGYKITVLVDDYTQINKMLPQGIHTYAQVCSTMYALNQTYSHITKLETLGLSYNNRLILAMKVTDNPLIEEVEPEIRLVGAHHGNEKISTEITLSFLKYLLENYATNQQVSYLINNREIWIIPILNPDGHIANSRYNGAGVDLNRDYGYMWQGHGNSPSPWSQPETRAMLKHSQNNNISLEYHYHSTASYVNYLWDHMPIDPPDSAYIIQISQEYADSTYGSPLTQLVKINGYDWYYVRGSAQDAVFGIFGNIGTTIETQYPTTQVKIDSVCLANRRALMAMITRAGWGISGIVRDSITQTPLSAMVKFINPKRWTVYTDKAVGDFHKMLPAGNYTFRVEANGYQPKTLTVTVPVNGVVEVTIDLRPDSTILNHIQHLIWVRRDRPDMVFRTITIDGLGRPDSNYYSLGPTGQIVLECNPPIRNFPGNDFTVFEGDNTPEYYSVSVANDWRGTFYSYGSVSGTQSFDLGTVGMDSVRYIKIVNTGSGSSSDPYAGFDLDGISYRQNPLSGINDETQPLFTDNAIAIWPTLAKNHLNIKINRSYSISTVKIYNIAGNIIKTSQLTNNAGIGYWKLDISHLPAGVYFCLIDQPPSKSYQQKIVIHR